MATSRDAQRTLQISRTLSFWLRHDPGAGGLTLDAQGWTAVDEVLAALNRGPLAPVGAAELDHVVTTNDKQRFMLRDGRIRASQGHSLDVELDLRSVEPPPVLYHGTTVERWQRIQESGGLAKMQRHHVHLSADIASARRVAGRHRGETPIVLSIDAAAARAAGHPFFISDNGVSLTDAVAVALLRVADPDR
jgi:putative RNA 2'-phosphotransferase